MSAHYAHFQWYPTRVNHLLLQKKQTKKNQKCMLCISFSVSLFHSLPQIFFPPLSPAITIQLRPPQSSADAHPTPTIR